MNAASRLLARRDRVDVAREVEVQVLHRHDLREPAAGRAALDAEDRAQRWLADGQRTGFLPMYAEALRQRDRGRRLALAGGVGVIAVTSMIFAPGRSASGRSRTARSWPCSGRTARSRSSSRPAASAMSAMGWSWSLLGDLEARLHEGRGSSTVGREGLSHRWDPLDQQPAAVLQGVRRTHPQRPGMCALHTHLSPPRHAVRVSHCWTSGGRHARLRAELSHRVPELRPAAVDRLLATAARPGPLYEPGGDPRWRRSTASGCAATSPASSPSAGSTVTAAAAGARSGGTPSRTVRTARAREAYVESIDFEGQEHPVRSRATRSPRRSTARACARSRAPSSTTAARGLYCVSGRLPELPRARRRRGRRARVPCAARATADGRAPERLAVRRPRRAQRLRQDRTSSCRSASTTRR